MTSQPPTGTVTFLFTDIEGSTRLWDRHPVAMADALAIHDGLLSSIVDETNGYVFSQAGDGWGIAFASAFNALTAAMSMQGRLRAAAWPEDIDAIPVRMGVHAGTATLRARDYFGTAVNRAARVAGIANGGQIFITDAVRSLVVDEADPAWVLRDLGEHRLRDLSRPERLWQLDHVDFQAPLAMLAGETTKGNLPRPRGSVVGREHELSDIVDCIRSDRVVTLVGVGGVGKTTVSILAGANAADDFSGGVWFVDLSATTDPEHVAGAVAGSLGIPARVEMNQLESLIDGLAVEPRLVVLDNAEHLIEAVASLVDSIVTAVPDVHVLVTSREPVDVLGEKVYRIGPLDTSVPRGQSPAVELFIERARATAPDLDDESFDQDIVHSICQRLDGLPLAIELAASQSETMTPLEILSALEANNLELRTVSRSTVQRHRSMADLVAWSYDLLTPAHRTVFERLSVFKGGCTLEAAVVVCGDDAISAAEVRSAVSILVRKSLVVTKRLDGATRLSMLETLRQFSADKFAEAEGRNSVYQRHAEWFAAQSAAGRKESLGPGEARYLAAMIADVDNLQAATEWAYQNRAFDLMTDIGASLAYLLGSSPSLAAWVEDAVGEIPARHNARLEYALALAGNTIFSGGIARAPELFATLTEDVEDQSRRADMMGYVTQVSRFFQGDIDFVIEYASDAIERAVAADLLREAGAMGTDLALANFYAGDTDRASEVAADVLGLANQTGSPSLLAWALYVEGEIIGGSDPERAVELLEESVDNGLSVANEFVVGISLTALSSIAGRNGDVDTALDAMHRCIRLWRTAGNRPQMWTAIRNLVEVLHSLGDDESALTLHEAVEADSDHAPALFGPFGDHYRNIVESTTAALDSQQIDRARRRGGSLVYATAAQFALDTIDRSATLSRR